MKRERFLWPLTHGHHHGLTAARNIEARLSKKLSKGATTKLAGEVRNYFQGDLSKRFRVESKVFDLFARHVGYGDIDLVRIFRVQRELKSLALKGTVESMHKFAAKLRSTIFYEADWLFDRIEENLTEGEKLEAFDEVRKFDPAYPKLPKAA